MAEDNDKVKSIGTVYLPPDEHKRATRYFEENFLNKAKVFRALLMNEVRDWELKNGI